MQTAAAVAAFFQTPQHAASLYRTDTLNGKIKLKVPPGTQNGTKVRLKGKGFPVYKQEGHFGDLYITYHVKIPVHLSEQEKKLFTELSKLKA